MIGPLNALVIDDDTQVRELVERELADDGWSVSMASDAAEAEVLLQEQVWTLVFWPCRSVSSPHGVRRSDRAIH